MRDIKTLTKTAVSGYTPAQKINFFKFFFSRGREALRYLPVTLSIVATGRCTLACDMCPTHSKLVPSDYKHTQKTKTDMDFGMFKNVIDRFGRAITVHIIGSGEPLLNKDLFKMVSYAASRHMLVKTISNGTVLSQDNNIDRILSSELEGITISLNGHNKEEFSRMTGMRPYFYDTIYDNVKKLVARKNATGSKVRVKLSFILDKDNARHISEMIAVALRLGVDHTFFCNFLPAPFDGLKPEERILCTDEEPSFLKDAYLALSASERRKFTFPPLLNRDRQTKRCESHFFQMRVDGEGNVSSCSMMLLNMERNGKFYDNDVWNNEFFRSMRRAFIARSAALPDPCNNCVSNYGESL